MSRSPVAENPTWQAPFRRSSSVLPVISCTTRFPGFPTGRRHDHEEHVADLAYRLAREAEAVCRHYLSNGRRSGNYWLVGDVRNTSGRSMFVRLTGDVSGKRAAGKWIDAATGEHGDLLDVIRESCGLVDFHDVTEEARRFLRYRTAKWRPDAGRVLRPYRPVRRNRRVGCLPCRSRSPARSRNLICACAASRLWTK